jgi:hypothetical protein
LGGENNHDRTLAASRRREAEGGAMHTITFYPNRSPSLDEVKRFVQSFPDGDWVTGAEGTRGVIESDDGRVYLDYDAHYREYFDTHLDAQQRAGLAARLGFAPALALHVHASHVYQHSRDLAQSVCERLARGWGGGWTE